MRVRFHIGKRPEEKVAILIGGVTFIAVLWAVGQRNRNRPAATKVLPGPVPAPSPQATDDAIAIVDQFGIDYALASKIVQVSEAVRIQNPIWLATVINFESRFDPRARNSSGATGLLQFMPQTAEDLGTTTTAISRMSALEQMDLVQGYFSHRWIANKAPFRSQLDVFMAVFYPAAVGRGPGYRFPAWVTRSNPGIYTAGDYLRKALDAR